jgi:phosphatidylserine synthase
MDLFAFKIIVLVVLMILMVTDGNIQDLAKKIKRAKLLIMLALLLAFINVISNETFLSIVWMVCSYIWLRRLKAMEKLFNEGQKPPKV